MIYKAKQRFSKPTFKKINLNLWNKENQFNIIYSMEFLYYLKDPKEMLKQIQSNWLKENGILVAGVDHYLENEESLTWPKYVGVHMTTMSKSEWRDAMEDAGFQDVEIHQVAAKGDFPGTLVMIGRNRAV